MGLAFQSRYQTGILIASAGLWFICFSGFQLKHYALLLTGFLLTFAMGVSIDHWGYGEYQITAWKYFSINLLEGKAQQWGTDPFYAYFYWTLIRGIPPLSVFMIAGTLICWGWKRRFSLTWITLPFIIIHSLISHKELRFLFQVAPLIPLMALMVLDFWKRYPETRFPKLKAFTFKMAQNRVLIWTIIIINGVALAVASFRPLRTEMGIYRYAYTQSTENLLYMGHDPFVAAGLKVNFYRPKGLSVYAFSQSPEMTKPYTLISNAKLGEDWTYCTQGYQSIPDWLDRSPLKKRAKILVWYGYFCTP